MAAKLKKTCFLKKKHEGNRQKLWQSNKLTDRKMDSQKKGGQTKNNNNQANK